MTGRLSSERIKELTDAAIKLGLYDRRQMLLLGLPPNFHSNMPITQGGRPGDQLAMDLNHLNEAGVLKDRSDPLETWLKNAIRAAGHMQEEEVFQRALLELSQPAPPRPRRRLLKLEGASWEPAPDRPEYREAVTHASSRVPIQFLEDGQIAGQSVALVRVARFDHGEMSDDWERAEGTGWLIGPRLLITAYHLINARLGGEPPADTEDLAKQVLNTQVTFGYDREGQHGTAIAVTHLTGHSRLLDYVLLRLEADPGVPPLLLATEAPSVGQGRHPPLNIVHHPNGRPKMLAFRGSLATTVTDLPGDLGYFTAAEKAASGAPIFNDDWQVVAMHRAAAQVKGVMFQGVPIAWANVGTRVTAIRDDLQQRSPRVWQSISDAQPERPELRLASVRPITGPGEQRLGRSIDALRELVQSIADSYQAGQTDWVWDKASLHEELDRTRQQLKVISDGLTDTDLSASSLRAVLSRHDAVADRLVQRLNDLEATKTPTIKRSIHYRAFNQAGDSLVDLLTRIQEKLRSLGPGHDPSGLS